MRRTAIARCFVRGLLPLVIAACSSGGDGTGPGGAITLALSPTSASVAQGGQTTVTGTLTRSGGFTGTVNLTVSNVPADVSATVSNVQTSGGITTATITVLVGLTAAVGGPTTLTVHGTRSGVNEATAPFDLSVTAAPNFALGVTPAGTVTLQQGAADNSKTISITRTNYTGAITLVAEGLPSGVSAAFAGNPVSGGSSLLTLSATAGATVGGPVTVTIRGTGSAPSLNVTTTLTLTVTAAGSFVLALTPSGAVTLAQGSQDNSRTVSITRSNYAGAVTLAAEGLPSGVTAVFAGNPVSGNSSLMTLTATAGAAVGGPTTVTVRGTGPAALRTSGSSASVEATTSFSLNVTAAPAGANVTVDFSGCTLFQIPSKLFVQDGNGAWVKVTGNNNVYSFTVNQAKAGIMRVLAGPFGTIVDLEYLTKVELTFVQPYRFCQPDPTRITVNTTVQNAGAADQVDMSMGNWTNFSVGNSAVGVLPSLPGPFDLIGYASGSADRMLLIPGLTPVDNGTVGPADFQGAFSFNPGAGNMTVSGIQAGETAGHAMSYHTGGACYTAVLYNGRAITGGSFQMRGAANSITNTRPTDFHEVMITTSGSGSTIFRSLSLSLHTMQNGSVTLGSNLAAPTVNTLSGNFKRLEVVFVLPPEYQTSAAFSYFATNAGPQRSVVVGATYLYLGGAGSRTLGFPDMAVVTGWDDADMPATTRTGSWNISATETTGPTRCSEGWSTFTGTRAGLF